jgi:hypothetical protein
MAKREHLKKPGLCFAFSFFFYFWPSRANTTLH